MPKTAIKGGPVEIVPLSVPGALDASGVSLILIDSACTDHIFELLAAFRRTRPHLRLIVLGLEEDHEYIQRIIGAGAKGYLAHTAKAAKSGWRSRSFRTARRGHRERCSPISWTCRQPRSRRADTLTEPKFTEREPQVLKLLVEGHPNRVIAAELGIDLATVKKHVGTLMRKVGVKNRIALSVQVDESQAPSGVIISARRRRESAKISDPNAVNLSVNTMRSKVYLPSYRCDHW